MQQIEKINLKGIKKHRDKIISALSESFESMNS